MFLIEQFIDVIGVINSIRKSVIATPTRKGQAAFTLKDNRLAILLTLVHIHSLPALYILTLASFYLFFWIEHYYLTFQQQHR
jgi:hypothetical protein